MILFDLLKKDFLEFDLPKKIRIYIVKSMFDRLTAKVEEYYITEIPFRLLRKKVYKVYYLENTIEVFE